MYHFMGIEGITGFFGEDKTREVLKCVQEVVR